MIRSLSWLARGVVGLSVFATGLVALSAPHAGAMVFATGRAPATPVKINKLIATSHREHGLIIYGNAPAPYFKPVITAFELAVRSWSVCESFASSFSRLSVWVSAGTARRSAA